MTEQSVEWYLARDGSQFGPLADSELRKLVELGHLKPDDLLWRDGMAEWQPAATLFRPPAPVMQPPMPQVPVAPVSVPSPAPTAGPLPGPHPVAQSARTESDVRTQLPSPRRDPGPSAHAGRAPSQERPLASSTTIRQVAGGGRSGSRRVVALVCTLIGVMVVLGVGWFGRASFIKTSASIISPQTPSDGTVARDTRGSSEAPPPDRPQPVPQIKAGAEEAVDKELQASLLWQVMKTEFPEWYVARVQETTQLKASRKDAAEIARQQMTALVKLRREHLNDALSATLPRLSAVATAFHDSLVQLTKQSTAACFGFVSQGELSPPVMALLDQPAQRQHIDSLMASIFMAIADGRKSPRVYPPPKQGDYQVLTAQLSKRGWSDADLQLFSNAQELSKTKPEKVCSMVRDWFAAQLEVTDVQSQTRLLAEALKPLISG